MAGRMNANVAAIAFIFVAFGAQAQALRDPTRPP